MPGMVRWIMRIIIAGASGLIGTALSSALRSAGHDVGTLVRRPPASPAEFQWDPAEGSIDDTALKGADAVINLSGAGIGDRPWTRARINELRSSRLGATRTLTAAMGRLDTPPAVFLSQSGVRLLRQRRTRGAPRERARRQRRPGPDLRRLGGGRARGSGRRPGGHAPHRRRAEPFGRRPGTAAAAAAPGGGRPAGQRPAVLAVGHAARCGRRLRVPARQPAVRAR